MVDLLQVTHAPERIEEYREAIARGESFPPLAVISFAGRYFIADGHKRLSAYRSLSVSHVEVELWSVGRWLGDQMRQARGKAGQALGIIGRLPFDRTARRQGWRLLWDTLGHWRRIVLSMRDRLRRGR